MLETTLLYLILFFLIAPTLARWITNLDASYRMYKARKKLQNGRAEYESGVKR